MFRFDPYFPYDGTWPYAQRLANYLDSTVIAPTADITFDENGKVEINPQQGYFKVFKPISR